MFCAGWDLRLADVVPTHPPSHSDGDSRHSRTAAINHGCITWTWWFIEHECFQVCILWLWIFPCFTELHFWVCFYFEVVVLGPLNLIQICITDWSFVIRTWISSMWGIWMSSRTSQDLALCVSSGYSCFHSVCECALWQEGCSLLCGHRLQIPSSYRKWSIKLKLFNLSYYPYSCPK